MKIQAVCVSKEQFSEYGRYINMISESPDTIATVTGDFTDRMTSLPLLDTIPSLGVTIALPAPYVLLSMEKHHHTQEAILCMDKPIILCVAKEQNDRVPMTESIKAFILSPGDAVVIDRDVWHDACRGIGEAAAYYWIATPGISPPVWVKIESEEEIKICLDEA